MRTSQTHRSPTHKRFRLRRLLWLNRLYQCSWANASYHANVEKKKQLISMRWIFNTSYYTFKIIIVRGWNIHYFFKFSMRFRSILVFILLLTFEQPGVNAPGTANKTTFLFAHNSAIFILLAGESSNKSTLGTLSPSYECQIKPNLSYHVLKVNEFLYYITNK